MVVVVVVVGVVVVGGSGSGSSSGMVWPSSSRVYNFSGVFFFSVGRLAPAAARLLRVVRWYPPR